MREEGIPHGTAGTGETLRTRLTNTKTRDEKGALWGPVQLPLAGFIALL